MDLSINLPDPEVRGFGVVRDKNGNPKVDGRPDDLPDEIKAALTASDRKYLGME